ncbi:MAG: hypothetical protein IJZ47_04325 [Oscillospiraceae bacterium]|nr:hypothetical protein [Oscillospiraceae bacterium]
MRKLLALLLAGMLALTGCAQSKPAEDDILTQTSVITTIYPDGSVYQSMDNGINWTHNGEKYGIPRVYITLRTDQPLNFHTQNILTFHNNALDSVTFDDYRMIIQMYSEGEWVYPNGGYSFMDAKVVELKRGTAADYWMILSGYEEITGRYRYTYEFDGYTCMVEFTAIA